MIDAIKSFMTNKIVLEWVKPILIPLVVALISYVFGIIYKRKKSINVIKTINVANKRLIDSIRPFFIQEIKLQKDVLISIRNSIGREYDIEVDSLLSIEQIKENIILDASETRFLKEQDKIKLINFIDNTFDEYQINEYENIKEEKSVLMKEKNRVRDYNEKLWILILLAAALLIMAIAFLPTNNLVGNILLAVGVWILGALVGVSFCVILSKIFIYVMEKKDKKRL